MELSFFLFFLFGTNKKLTDFFAIFMMKMSINTPCMTTNSNTKAGADKVFSVNLIDFLSDGHTSFVRDCYQQKTPEFGPVGPIHY